MRMGVMYMQSRPLALQHIRMKRHRILTGNYSSWFLMYWFNRFTHIHMMQDFERDCTHTHTHWKKYYYRGSRIFVLYGRRDYYCEEACFQKFHFMVLDNTYSTGLTSYWVNFCPWISSARPQRRSLSAGRGSGWPWCSRCWQDIWPSGTALDQLQSQNVCSSMPVRMDGQEYCCTCNVLYSK